jgi:lipoate-protein ligase A
LFSTVRANESGQVGFLKDWRRLNVALTRPRCGVVVLGHKATLSNDTTWSNWLKYVSENNLELPQEQIDSFEENIPSEETEVKEDVMEEESTTVPVQEEEEHLQQEEEFVQEDKMYNNKKEEEEEEEE